MAEDIGKKGGAMIRICCWLHLEKTKNKMRSNGQTWNVVPLCLKRKKGSLLWGERAAHDKVEVFLLEDFMWWDFDSPCFFRFGHSIVLGYFWVFNLSCFYFYFYFCFCLGFFFFGFYILLMYYGCAPLIFFFNFLMDFILINDNIETFLRFQIHNWNNW